MESTAIKIKAMIITDVTPNSKIMAHHGGKSAFTNPKTSNSEVETELLFAFVAGVVLGVIFPITRNKSAMG